MARILFIGIEYYSYASEIEKSFIRQGHEVVFHAIEPTDLWSKIQKKIMPSVYRRKLDDYHASIVRESARNKFDIVLFVQVHQFSQENMEALRSNQSDARFILYNWDSLSTHDYRSFLPVFDKAVTFDRRDADFCQIEHLPLFAVQQFFKARPDRPKEYDLYFVGSIATLNRVNALRKLKEFCDAESIRLKLYMHCSPLMMARMIFTGRYLPGMTLKSVSFDEIIAIMERSRAVCDFANHQQTGYTMRLIENMCAGKKIVTDNYHIRDESFYSADRFLIVDKDASRLDALPEFLERSPPDADFSEAFSIDAWARELLKSG